MVKGITYILTHNVQFQDNAGLNNAGIKYKAYPVICPQPEKFPYSTVRQLSSNPFQCKGSLPTTFTYQYVVHSFHVNYDNVVNLDNAVIAALNGQSGVHNGVNFQSIRYLTTSDDYIGEYKLYVRQSVFEAVVHASAST